MEAEMKKLFAFVSEWATARVAPTHLTGQLSESDITDEPLYETLLNMLSAYIDAELDGQEPALQFPELKAALEASPSLREIYEEASSLLRLERQGALPEPMSYPEFDFSYLAQLSKPTPIWHIVERAGKEVTELFNRLSLVISEGQAFFENLPNTLRLESQMVGLPSRSSPEVQVPVLLLPSSEHDLSLHLSLTPSQPEEKETTLRVQVMRLSSEQRLSRCRVVLRDANYRMLESHFTDELGKAAFTGVSSGNYVIDVKDRGRILQLPIEVKWAGTAQLV